MASAATSTISHNLHPLPIVSVPRIRPPRIPKGTPNANTNPQPNEKVPNGKVWVQGKWREQASNAAKDRQQKLSRQVEKALRHETHGMNIYAYNHIRTKQVVYSLTRIMNNNNIIKQLQYFGKKTVPRALRRDMWTPYYSIHFPPTEAGAEAGKLAYHRLRELSLQRQLSPPDELVRTSQDDIDKFKARFNPVEWANRKEENDFKHPIPILGQRLPKRLRAQRLMDQKSTSVADAAFVLGLHVNGPTPEEVRQRRAERMMERWKKMGRRAKTRLKKIRELEARRAELVKSLAKRVKRIDENQGQLLVDRYAMERISMEHQGFLTRNSGVHGLENIEEAKAAKALEAGTRKELEGINAEIQAFLTSNADVPTGDAEKAVATESTAMGRPTEGVADVPPVSGLNLPLPADPFTVRVNWADMRDGTYAQQWPKNVLHGELARMAVAKSGFIMKREGKYINKAGITVDGPIGGQAITQVISRSVHVMGSAASSSWVAGSRQLTAAQQARNDEIRRNVERREAAIARQEAKNVERLRGRNLSPEARQRENQERRKQRLEKEELEKPAQTGAPEVINEVEIPPAGFFGRIKSLFRRK